MILRIARSIMFLIFLLSPFSVAAQTSPPPAAAPSQAAAPPQSKLLTPEALDALVAPVALYPDNLLSQVLMASTFPLEVVHAERWLKANKNLKGDKLEAAVAEQSWDDSIKSLVATPSVLEMMSGKLDWTQKLGDAVVEQQPDVMDAVQRLRAKAQANNKLKSTKEQSVTVSQSQGKQVIAIAPTDPSTVYVPYYDPAVMYGPWPYPAYPPYYWPPPGYIAGGLIATGLAFGAGYALGRWASGGYWGGNVNWNNNNITINRPGGGGGNWNRNAHVEHRGGNRGNRGNRQLDFRGGNGQRVLNPGGNRGNLGGGNLANRPSTRPAGERRHHASTRPAGGNRAERPNAGNRQTGNRVQHHRTAGSGRAANLGSRGGGGGLAGGGRGGGGGLASHHRAGGGGGGHRAGGGGHHRGGGGGGGGGRGGGGRRSDIRLKHDIVLVGRLSDGLGIYRFVYNGGHKAYVGVIAQEAQQIMPKAVERGADGYLRVHYEKLGVKFESYQHWLDSGSHLPTAVGFDP